MDKRPIRVAQMMTDMNYGGVETAIMNYYRFIDKSKVQFDFFALEGSLLPQKEEIESLGGKVYIVPRYTNLLKYEHEIQKLLREYDIVHSNMNTLSFFSLWGAKMVGVPNRILHNHSTLGKGEKKNIFKYLLRPLCRFYPTERLACSQHAGEWMFGSKQTFMVVKNAIDISKYKFNQAVRDKMRKELGIENKFVVGHIGRFCYQKNQEFLIEIFNEISSKTNAVLLLIGSGETQNTIKRKVAELGLNDKVIFAGNKTNACDYYQAMDSFVLPSRYEGLGMVAIEAQASGLPVVCSTKVPDEVKITNSVKFLSLDSSAVDWSNSVLSNIVFERKDTSAEIEKAGYDITTEAQKLCSFYEGLINNA